MKTQHTPGKWSIDTLKSGGNYIVGRNKKTFIGTIYSGHTDKQLQKEQEANAALIAAAPELLAACENVHAFVHELIDERKKIDGEGISYAHAKLLDYVENAINKAKGL